MGDGLHRAATQAKLTRVPEADKESVKKALENSCDYCKASAGHWCMMPSAAGGLLTKNLHKARLKHV